MNNKFLQLFALSVLIVITSISCKKDEIEPDQVLPETSDFSNEVALEWMNFYLEIERFTPGYRPPVSARTLGYVGLTAYESVVNGMPDYNSFSGYYFGLSTPQTEPGVEYHWPTCLHAAYSKSFLYFFPTAPAAQQQKMFLLMQKYNDKFTAEVPFEVYNRSKAYGEAVADAVFDWSKTDAVGHEAYLHNTDANYIPPSGTGLWQPTYPDYSLALLPHWGEARTFAANHDDIVPPPIPYSENQNSELYIQAKEVMIKVNNIKAGNPDYPDDEWIANFWSDDCPTKTFTPAARWIAIANQVIDQKNLNLEVTVYAFAKIGMGLNDAGVRCWNEKYRFNILRPIDYIRNVLGSSDWNTIMCPSSGNYYTPNFPAYPSGHATFGAASAEVMSEVFGNYSMTDRCHEGRVDFIGTPRSFNNFFEMAEENAYSRLPIGVHFRMDAEEGVNLGFKIGKKINNLPWKN